MKFILLAGMMAAAGTALVAQDRDIPKDSELVTVRGCANGRNFVVGPRSEDQPGTLEIEPGRRMRLNAKGDVLNEIRKRERMMIEVTGIVKKSDVAGPGGISIAGGRIRIGGAQPRAGINDPGRDPQYNVAVIDVQSWRSLPDPCPDR